jgi:protein-ribulosamine 3-kinase
LTSYTRLVFSLLAVRLHTAVQAGKGESGRELMYNHFVAESHTSSFIPEYVPKPLGFSTYQDDPNTHFCLLEFVDMLLDDTPSAQDYMRPVAALHTRSMGKSPDGKFGFPIRTRFASLPQDNSFEESWEFWWTRHMKMVMAREEEVRGEHTPEVKAIVQGFFDEILPRYLRPLESDGRKLQACLLHGDLWPGNVTYLIDNETVVMFDAHGLWGHNES